MTFLKNFNKDNTTPTLYICEGANLNIDGLIFIDLYCCSLHLYLFCQLNKEIHSCIFVSLKDTIFSSFYYLNNKLN